EASGGIQPAYVVFHLSVQGDNHPAGGRCLPVAHFRNRDELALRRRILAGRVRCSRALVQRSSSRLGAGRTGRYRRTLKVLNGGGCRTRVRRFRRRINGSPFASPSQFLLDLRQGLACFLCLGRVRVGFQVSLVLPRCLVGFLQVVAIKARNGQQGVEAVLRGGILPD